MRGHYHCLRTGCYFVTNITTKLPWHIKKHEKAERRAANGFKYFTKREECGRLGTDSQGRGQGLVAGSRAVAIAPEALVAWVTSLGIYVLPPHIRLQVLLKMSQILQTRDCQTGKTAKTQEPTKRGTGDSERCTHPSENALALTGQPGPDLVLFPFQAGFPASVKASGSSPSGISFRNFSYWGFGPWFVHSFTHLADTEKQLCAELCTITGGHGGGSGGN